MIPGAIPYPHVTRTNLFINVHVVRHRCTEPWLKASPEKIMCPHIVKRQATSTIFHLNVRTPTETFYHRATMVLSRKLISRFTIAMSKH